MLYKTTNGQLTGFVPGVGAIVDGKIETDQVLESSNLQAVEAAVPVAPAVPVVSSNPVATSEPVQTTNTEVK